jgi:hypothetical protein
MPRRVAFGLVLAAATGLSIGWMDSRPGFDATGITVVLLVIAAGAGTFLVSSATTARLWRPILVALLVGGWVPIFEMSGEGGPASLASLAFAAIGAVGGYLAALAVRQGGLTVR